MIPIESRHPPGIVGIAAGELARYTEFTASFSGLCAPAGTNVVVACSYDVAYNRNDCIRTMLKSPDAQWVHIYDDDHVFTADTLIKLLDRDVDVVVPLYTQRQPPFNPCLFKTENEDGTFTLYQWPDLEGKEGLLSVVSAGAGGILIRRHVIEKLAGLDGRDEPEWFERLGKSGEDHVFFRKCRAAGFTVYVDLETRIDHLTPVKVRAHRDAAGRWCGVVDLKRKTIVEFWPDPQPLETAAVTG